VVETFLALNKLTENICWFAMSIFLEYLEQVLNEAQDYTGMFNRVQNAPSPKMYDNKFREAVDKYVSWARFNLKKNDRIVWFLRWARYDLSCSIGANKQDMLAELNGNIGTSYTEADIIPIGQLMRELQHFVGLPDPAIQKVIFARQSPKDITDTFRKMVEAWKSKAGDDTNAGEMYQNNRLIEAKPSDDIILRFPDGYAWVDLRKHRCDVEGKAMGHCGNAAATSSSDTILSLRKEIRFRSKKWWYPVCTFILDNDGMLGEMKGRNNDKPQPRYHPYIVALLRTSSVSGIKGGGYMPSHNFSINDLDEGTKDELIDEKPELGNAYDLFQKEGMTKRVLSALHRDLNAKGIDSRISYDAEGKRFELESWTDFASFLRTIDDDDVEKILEICLGEADFQTNKIEDVHGAFLETVAKLPEHWQNHLIERSGILPSGDGARDAKEAAMALSRKNDELFQVFEDVFKKEDNIKRQAWERLKLYIKAGWAPVSIYAYFNIPDGDKIRAFVENEDSVVLYMDEGNVISLTMPNNEDEDEGYEAYRIAADGWEAMDDEYVHDRRRELKLVDNRSSKDVWLQNLRTDSAESLVDDYVAKLSGSGGQFNHVDDPRQDELSFESDLLRYKQLSGLKG